MARPALKPFGAIESNRQIRDRIRHPDETLRPNNKRPSPSGARRLNPPRQAFHPGPQNSVAAGPFDPELIPEYRLFTPAYGAAFHRSTQSFTVGNVQAVSGEAADSRSVQASAWDSVDGPSSQRVGYCSEAAARGFRGFVSGKGSVFWTMYMYSSILTYNNGFTYSGLPALQPHLHLPRPHPFYRRPVLRRGRGVTPRKEHPHGYLPPTTPVISAVQGYEIPLSRDFKHHTFHL